ncbi:MAG: hypothetical protein RLY93_08925 [Sumerlaeia bacterium]
MPFVRDAESIVRAGYGKYLQSATFSVRYSVEKGDWQNHARPTAESDIWCTVWKADFLSIPPLYLFYSVSSQTITFHRALLGTT